LSEIPEEIQQMSFEQALAELEEIVQQLETGQVSLEQSIDQYSRGNLLKLHCEEKLKDASERIEKITRQQDNTLETAPFDVEG